jgi:glycosyltransferase involved in cell wall biosynthesis
MNPTLCVLISTHNPHLGRLQRTLDGLRQQTAPRETWELVLVDNASADPTWVGNIDLSWHPQGRLVREEKLGLTYGRLAALKASSASLIVFADDDNVLDKDYLAHAGRIFEEHPTLGAIGGKSTPEWEKAPPEWIHEFAGCLALRDLGDEILLADRKADKGYPRASPIGAGMCIRRDALAPWVNKLGASKGEVVTGRCGTKLTSSEDNDIILELLAAGWGVGYFPQLRLTHLMPEGRTTRDYMARLNEGISRSWVVVLGRHGICPWRPIPRWGVWPRKMRAYCTARAWRDDAAYIRWRQQCGLFDGQADLGAEMRRGDTGVLRGSKSEKT